MKTKLALLFGALVMLSANATAAPISGYPPARTPLTGAETMIGTQAGSTVQITTASVTGGGSYPGSFSQLLVGPFLMTSAQPDGSLDLYNEVRINDSPGKAPLFGRHCNVSDTELAFATDAASDTANEFNIACDGQMNWGPGNGPVDTIVFRSGVSTLRFFQDTIQVDEAITAGAFIRPGLVTVATLSSLDPSPQTGDAAAVSDAMSCTANSGVAGGGGTTCALIYSGTAWKAAVTH